MTTPNTPDKITAAELRNWLQKVHKELLEVHDLVDKLRIEMDARQPQPATAAPGAEVIQATTVIKSYDPQGRVMVHILGGRYTKHGARAWPEYLDALGINPEKLNPGPNPYARKILVQPAQNGNAPKAIRAVE